MRWIQRIGLAAAVVAMAAGCGEEGPTDVVSDLVGEGVRTVRVVYDASDFLQGDTVYDRFGALQDATFGIVASSYGGDMDAHVLFDVFRPLTVDYPDTTGTVVRDTIATVHGGQVTVFLDSLAYPAGPVDFEVVDVTESWDVETVSWTARADTSGTPEPWTTAGGTPGQVLATATWESGDTLIIPLDSAAAAVWDDTASDANGGMLRLATPGARARIRAINVKFDVTPTGRDTTVTTGGVRSSVIVSPAPPAPAAGVLRLGGLPVWRSLLHFKPMDDLRVPCEQGSTTCDIALSEVTVSAANLLVWTAATSGYRTERAMRVEGRAVLEAPTVPLTRSPLSAPFSSSGDTLSEAAFTSGGSVMARVPVTGFVQRNSNVGDDESPILWLALASAVERTLFGYGEFGGLGSANAPKLELVVTVPVRKVTP